MAGIAQKIAPVMLLLMSFALISCAQTHPDYEAKLDKLYKYSVPLIRPAELKDLQAKNPSNLLILDTRAQEEYEVSHIPGATFVDYDNFSKDDLKNVSRDKKVIVYCSVGYRSERIGEKLQKMGFDDVSNLYGGIFEWVNEGNTVVDEQNHPTQKVHTYNEKWGQWLRKGEKVW